ncbi:DUF333 domain-containing protein [Sphingomonas sp. NCPPB 2930]|uniref:putative hemolysin n=1 Tax=Sphingomonas sp. NCPPB 2930 TaxID=3162788 RepID=UPI0036D947AE
MKDGYVMDRLAYVATGLLICAGVPALILTSAEAFPQVSVQTPETGACLRTGGVSILVDGTPYCRQPNRPAIDEQHFPRPRPGIAVMSNPASAYCEELGGTLETVDAPDGQTGYCHLPNGAVVEEWALYRGR